MEAKKYQGICPACGKLFTTNRSWQKYCSVVCRRRENHHNEKIHAEPQAGKEILRIFWCRMCGKEVRVTDPKDKRTVFCCQPCERKYWKHADRYKNKHARESQGMSGGMSLGSLIRRERRDLD